MASLYQVPINRADGSATTFGEYEGKVVLVVNVASECGLTPQYTALEVIYEKYRDRGFVVVGFPCNDFGAQEPGTAEQIHEFCTTKFGVQFPILEKITVAPANRHPIYRELIGDGAAISWNFEKFLVDRTGKVIERFAPDVTPDSARVTGAIEAAL